MKPVHFGQCLGSSLAVHGADEKLGRDQTGVVDASSHILGTAQLTCVHKQPSARRNGESLEERKLPTEDVDERTVVQHGQVHDLVCCFVIHCMGVFEEWGIFTLEVAKGAESQEADESQIAEN